MRSPVEIDGAGSPVPASLGPARRSGHDRAVLILSIAIQLLLGVLFGHVYDMRLFMAAGHQVAAGQNPYVPADLSLVFHDPAFRGITTVGYPPPWPLLLGGIYGLTYATVPSLLIYNLAIKLPIILANVGLAYLAAACLRRLGLDEARTRTAWTFILLNPFLLYASAAWGQFDSIVAVLSLASLMLLNTGRRHSSAALLALAVSFKPTAIPLLWVPFFFLRAKGPVQILRYYAVLGLSTAVLCAGPFVAFGWDPGLILQNWNAHFVVGGGLSPLATLELLQDSYRLPGSWWLLGLLWLPALCIGSLGLRHGITDLGDLLKKSAAMIMIFFLTRAWLSEPNIILVLPLLVILAAVDQLPRPWLQAVWILPLLFGIVNASAAQLFFPSMPHIMQMLLAQLEQVRTARLVAKVLVVLPWQFIGWRIVVRCLKRAQGTLTSLPG